MQRTFSDITSLSWKSRFAIIFALVPVALAWVWGNVMIAIGYYHDGYGPGVYFFMVVSCFFAIALLALEYYGSRDLAVIKWLAGIVIFTFSLEVFTALNVIGLMDGRLYVQGHAMWVVPFMIICTTVFLFLFRSTEDQQVTAGSDERANMDFGGNYSGLTTDTYASASTGSIDIDVADDEDLEEVEDDVDPDLGSSTSQVMLAIGATDDADVEETLTLSQILNKVSWDGGLPHFEKVLAKSVDLTAGWQETLAEEYAVAEPKPAKGGKFLTFAKGTLAE